MLQDYTLVLWDYNGTLIDDAGISLEIVNRMLRRRGKQPITMAHYRDTIDIPISLQYVALGFAIEEEGFDSIAREYNDIYNALSPKLMLREGVPEVLKYLKENNIMQAVLSSAAEQMVEEGLQKLGIFDYFDYIAARTDLLATGKTEIGETLLQKTGNAAQKTLMIGDMLHDFEVAQHLGCPCVLLKGGHTSVKLLKKAGVPLLKSPLDLLTANV